MAKRTSLDVVNDPDKPVHRQILSEAIVRISAAMKMLIGSGLNRRAIVVLVHDAIATDSRGRKIGLMQIGEVFDALEELEDRYCIKRKRKK